MNFNYHLRIRKPEELLEVDGKLIPAKTVIRDVAEQTLDFRNIFFTQEHNPRWLLEEGTLRSMSRVCTMILDLIYLGYGQQLQGCIDEGVPHRPLSGSGTPPADLEPSKEK